MTDHKRRLGNKGFSLLELLVGVMIMAIIIVPLLHTFLVGAGTEKKSRDYGDATGAAQNLTEQIQANDVDLILKNAGVIDSNAKFYSYDEASSSYISPSVTASPMPDGTDKTFYLGIPNYSYGGSTFDALVTLELDAEDAVNSTDVSVSNQIGAYLDMSAADTNAETALKTECGSVVDPNSLTKDMLTRSISLNITKIDGTTTDSYTIDALFNYSCTVDYTIDGEDFSMPFSHTEKASASVGSIAKTNDGSPIFSVYMFFDGYYRNDKTIVQNETIMINNPTGSDINTFIVNTNPTAKPSVYSALIWYKYQSFNGDTPVNNLVYTNLPTDTVYRAAKSYYQKKTLSVTGYLVQKERLDRKFDVNIKLYKAGSGFSGTQVLDFDSSKLN